MPQEITVGARVRLVSEDIDGDPPLGMVGTVEWVVGGCAEEVLVAVMYDGWEDGWARGSGGLRRGSMWITATRCLEFLPVRKGPIQFAQFKDLEVP